MYNKTLDEMKVFISLHIIFRMKQLPVLRLYWSKDPEVWVEAVQTVMPRNGFDKLVQFLHTDDN